MLMILGFTLTDTSTFFGILAILVPALFWGYTKLKSFTRKEFIEAQEQNLLNTDISKIHANIERLTNKLSQHMDHEEILSSKIVEMGEELLTEIHHLAEGVSASNVQMIKALMSSSSIPANLAEVYKDGHYDYVWANLSYLKLIDVSLQEFQSPGTVFLTISEDERDVVRQTGESVGRRQEIYDGEFMMVKPKTQEPIGRYRVIGHYVGNPKGEPYFYLTTYHPADEVAAGSGMW